jgi:hypothetical protein
LTVRPLDTLLFGSLMHGAQMALLIAAICSAGRTEPLRRRGPLRKTKNAVFAAVSGNLISATGRKWPNLAGNWRQLGAGSR